MASAKNGAVWAAVWDGLGIHCLALARRVCQFRLGLVEIDALLGARFGAVWSGLEFCVFERGWEGQVGAQRRDAQGLRGLAANVAA